MNENDREMLELAAKAAGIVYKTDAGYVWIFEQDLWTCWNPLTDDGDALRLAVALGLLVYVMRDAGFTGIRLPGEHIGGKYDEVEMHGTDPYAATRRAIVRAAAEIGRQKRAPDIRG